MCKITYYVWNKIIQGSLSRSVWKKFPSLEKFYTHIVAGVADYYQVYLSIFWFEVIFIFKIGLEKMARADGKMRQKYPKLKNGQKHFSRSDFEGRSWNLWKEYVRRPFKSLMAKGRKEIEMFSVYFFVNFFANFCGNFCIEYFSAIFCVKKTTSEM